MKCLECGTPFGPDEIAMIKEDGAELICDLCAVQEKNM